MFSIPEAARALGLDLEFPRQSAPAASIKIDSRQLQPGDFFCALKGEQTDGHLFLDQVFAAGASGALIDRSFFQANKTALSGYFNLIPADSPAKALQQLAAWQRAQYKIPFIGITGSVGKTSTKEFLRYLLTELEGENGVLANRGNFNNQLGLPITLSALTSGHRVCVAELGASEPDDIRELAGILKPDAAILTGVSACHLEGFGSLEQIYKTKLDLFRALPPDGTAVYFEGDAVIEKFRAEHTLRFCRTGFGSDAEKRLTDIRLTGDGWVEFCYDGRLRFAFPSHADFYVRNAGMALALLDCLGFDLSRLPERWEGFSLPDGRFSVKEVQGIHVIFDGYNASPFSFREALKSFSALPKNGGRRFLVFSDMLELGTEAETFHRELGESIASSPLDFVTGYGKWAETVLAPVRNRYEICVHAARDAEDAGDFILQNARPGDWVLFKASRGMRIEKSLQKLTHS